jgi:hypothetical protein
MIRAQTGRLFLVPTNSMSQYSAPGGIAETQSGSISRRKENCIEKRICIIMRHHRDTKSADAEKEV